MGRVSDFQQEILLKIYRKVGKYGHCRKETVERKHWSKSERKLYKELFKLKLITEHHTKHGLQLQLTEEGFNLAIKFLKEI